MEKKEFKPRKRSQRNQIVSGALVVIGAVEAFNNASPGIIPAAIAQAVPGVAAVAGLLINHFWKK